MLEAALKVPAGRHAIAATALEVLLETPDSQARELAALYSRYGQPTALRTTALGAYSRLAKDDPALQDILVSLVDDPDASVRYQVMGAVGELKLARAVPALRGPAGAREQRLQRVHPPAAPGDDRGPARSVVDQPSPAGRPTRPRASPSSRPRPPSSRSRPGTSAAGSRRSSSPARPCPRRPPRRDRPPAPARRTEAARVHHRTGGMSDSIFRIQYSIFNIYFQYY